MDCWACELARGDISQHKTTWHYVGQWGAVVEDLDAKGWAKRLLYVPDLHLGCGKETQAMRARAKALLGAVGRAVCVNEGLRVAQWDMDEHSYADHWHAQLCLEKEDA